MFKLIGAVLIIISTTWVGMESAKKLSSRTRQLRMLKVALQSLEAEIMYTHTPLKEAALKIQKQLSHPLNQLFAAFANRLEIGETTVTEAWDASLREVWGVLSLKQGEFEILSQFGEMLGKSDKYSQQKQILLTLTHLEREENEAIEIQGKYEKMFKSLGFLSGLLLIILLI